MAEKTSDLYDKAVAAVPNIDSDFVGAAKAFRDLCDTYPDEWLKFLDKQKVDKRKAYYLVAIDKAFRKLNVTKARLQRIGWTKLTFLTKHITDTNSQKLLNWAEQHNVRELRALVEGDKPPANSHCVMMYFNDADYAVYEKSLLKNGATRSSRGLVNKEEALIKALKKGA